MSRCCRTCQHLDVKPDAAGRIVVRKLNVYDCKAPLPDMPALPTSVLGAGFRWPPSRRWMSGDDGTDCRAWQKRTGGKR